VRAGGVALGHFTINIFYFFKVRDIDHSREGSDQGDADARDSFEG
jgi:hypothetical protein